MIATLYDASPDAPADLAREFLDDSRRGIDRSGTHSHPIWPMGKD